VVRVITASERRARLARRHHLAAEAPAADAVELADRLVGLHASEPSSVFLAARARIPDFVPANLETAMYDRRVLRKHLAMRRTLFVFPTELVPVVQAACTNAVLAAERKRLVKDVEQHGIAADGARWLAKAERATLEALAQGDATGAELSRAVPALRAKISIGEGRSWAANVSMTGRVLTVLAAKGRVVRGRPTGSWTSSRHRWALDTDGSIPAVREADARTELVRRWLESFGPGTLTDLTWWTGLGVTKIRPAVAALGVVEVDLEGEPGVVLPYDLDSVPSVAPWAAFLPTLDPTTMGWKLRDWYLGEHGPSLFDTSGNAGPTVWWNGRVVGGWVQQPSGEVDYRLLEDVGADAAGAIEREAACLQDWLGTTRLTPRFPSPVGRALRG
jgi:Winged helix DNA-binding domain